MSMAYIRKAYGVPAKRGAKILYNGNTYVITSTHGPHLRVKREGKPGTIILHPTYQITYLPEVTP